MISTKFLKSTGLALTAILFSAAIVSAAPLDNVNITSVLQKIKAGALTIKAPADVTLPDVYVSSQVETSNVTATNFQIDDARGTKVPAGWSATVTMNKLASATEGTDIPFIDTVTSNNDYKITPLNLQTVNGSSSTGVSLGSAEELTEVGTSGVSAAKTLVTASSGKGKGRYTLDVKLDLKVPANSTAADDYTSTMTFTVS